MLNFPFGCYLTKYTFIAEQLTLILIFTSSDIGKLTFQAGESEEEELTSVKSEIKSLKTDLHKALLEQEKTLVSS